MGPAGGSRILIRIIGIVCAYEVRIVGKNLNFSIIMKNFIIFKITHFQQYCVKQTALGGSFECAAVWASGRQKAANCNARFVSKAVGSLNSQTSIPCDSVEVGQKGVDCTRETRSDLGPCVKFG